MVDLVHLALELIVGKSDLLLKLLDWLHDVCLERVECQLVIVHAAHESLMVFVWVGLMVSGDRADQPWHIEYVFDLGDALGEPGSLIVAGDLDNFRSDLLHPSLHPDLLFKRLLLDVVLDTRLKRSIQVGLPLNRLLLFDFKLAFLLNLLESDLIEQFSLKGLVVSLCAIVIDAHHSVQFTIVVVVAMDL